MDLVAAVVADEQSFELVQPGEGALDDPAVAAEPGAVLGLAACDLGCDATPAELATAAVVVVATVGVETIGSAARPAWLAADGRDTVEQRDQLGAVVAVAARDRPGKPGSRSRLREGDASNPIWLYQPGSGPSRSPLFRLHMTAVDDRA